MFGPKPAARPRPMGGMHSMGQMSEHLDEDALQAMQQMSGQQGGPAASGGTAHSGSASGAGLGGTATPPSAPREVGTLQEELVTRPVHDVVEGLKSLFDLKAALGIDPQTDDPQTQAKKKQMLERFNQLTEEDQAFAQQQYQQRMQEKQRDEQEKAMADQQKAQVEAQSFSMPTGPQKGPVGPSGSKKQKAMQQLQHDRKTLSNAKGAH